MACIHPVVTLTRWYIPGCRSTAQPNPADVIPASVQRPPSSTISGPPLSPYNILYVSGLCPVGGYTDAVVYSCFQSTAQPKPADVIQASIKRPLSRTISGPPLSSYYFYNISYVSGLCPTGEYTDAMVYSRLPVHGTAKTGG